MPESHFIKVAVCNFIKKESQTQVFFCEFYYLYHLKHQLLNFSFFSSNFLMFNCSLGSCFCRTCLVIVIIQIHFDSHKVCTYVCYWISPHLVFFIQLMSWCKRKKNQENSSQCFTLGLGKTPILEPYFYCLDNVFLIQKTFFILYSICLKWLWLDTLIYSGK